MDRYSSEQKTSMPNLDLLIYKNGSRRKSKGKPHGLIPLLDIVDKVSIDVADTLATARMIQRIHQHELGYGQLASFGSVSGMPSHITDMLTNLMLVPAFAEEWTEAEGALEALKETYYNTVPLEQRRRAAAHKQRDALRRSEHVPVFRPLLRILSSEFNMQSDRHSGGGCSSSSSTSRQQQRRQRRQQQEPPQLLPSFKPDDPMEVLSLLLRTKRLLQRYMAGMLANLNAGGYMVMPLDGTQQDLYDLPYFMKLQALDILDPADFFGKHTSYSTHCRRQHKLDSALQKLHRSDHYANRPFCGNSRRWGLCAPAAASLSSKKLEAAGGVYCCQGRCRLCSSSGSSSSSSQHGDDGKPAASCASTASSSDNENSMCSTADAVECTPRHLSSGCSGSRSSSSDGNGSSSGGGVSSPYIHVKTATFTRCKIISSPTNSAGGLARAVTCADTASSTSSSSETGSTRAATKDSRNAVPAVLSIKSWWKATFSKSNVGTGDSSMSAVIPNSGAHVGDASCCIQACRACGKSKGRAADCARVLWFKADYLLFAVPA